MKAWILPALVGLTLGISTVASAQQTPPATPVPPSTPAAPAKVVATPEELAAGKAILDATIKAHGGDAFLNVKALKITGKGDFALPPEAGDIAFPLDSILLTISDMKARLDASTGFGDITFVTLGDKKPGWVKFMTYPIQEAPADKQMPIDPIGVLRMAVKAGVPFRPVMPAITEKSDDGKSLKAIEMVDPEGKPAPIFYVEADSSLLRRIRVPGGKDEASLYLGGYKEFSGLHLPTTFLIQQVKGDKKLDLLTMKFDKVEVNGTVDEKIFDKPVEAKPAEAPKAP